jgi:lysozyme
MTYSIECENMVKKFEGLRLEAYLCPANVWTIGWGHTEGVKQGDQIDEAVAEEMLEQDLANSAAALSSIIPSDLQVTQGEFDALVSLGFNLAGGPLAIPRVAPKLWAYFLDGNLPDAALEFLDIDKTVTGIVEPGLKARRGAESELFLEGANLRE